MSEPKKGVVPRLRFPEFRNAGPWEVKRLGEVCDTFSGGTPASSHKEYYGGSIPFIRSAEIDSEVTELHLTEAGLHNSSAKLVRKGDILIALYGANSGEAAIARIDGAINQAILCVRSQFNHHFILNYWLLMKRSITLRYLQGGQGNLSGEIVTSIEMPFPALPEQQKIADCLSSLDEVIELQAQKVTALKAYKKGLMQQLFPQEGETTPRLRFPEFRDAGPWELKRLGEVLEEHGLKSTGTEKVYSVSVHKGLVDQIEHLGRSFAAQNTDHYNRVLPGDVVYTKSPTGDFPYGIVKQNKTGQTVIVSPLYGVFRPQNYAIGVMLDAYFESPFRTKKFLEPLVQKGAKNTINISNDRLLSGALPLPRDQEEQQKIADCLSSLDEVIELGAQKIEALKAHKKGLMQQLFPQEVE